MAGSDIIVILGKGSYKSAHFVHKALEEIGFCARKLGIGRRNDYIIQS